MALKREIPQGGLVKTTQSTAKSLGPAQKVQLIRRGNECFNQGQYELAERIFLTCDYSDGLIRLGDFYFKKNEFQDAIRLYMKSKDQGRIEKLTNRMALVLRQWLLEDQALQTEDSNSGSEPTQGNAHD